MIVTNRIPFLPSRDVLFAGAGIELSALVGIPAAVMAGMLLVRTGIDKVLNTVFFALSQSRKPDEQPEVRNVPGLVKPDLAGKPSDT